MLTINKKTTNTIANLTKTNNKYHIRGSCRITCELINHEFVLIYEQLTDVMEFKKNYKNIFHKEAIND